ncbi:AAA family ATPase [Bosea sp. (in: a-proteobacteria)]|uniref:ATP-dependent nuclease n=1 Tax=Bosea sp. (in: a-proteobacteria) TaxID=1871050 RepID=UPI000A5327E7|nr:AAA family ATPase [Bosea sp. (in: a-proteobacteria)]
MAEQPLAHIRRIAFSNFKAFASYSLALSDVNILVGPNNSGKSTIIGALRTLDAAVRLARTRAPSRLHIGETTAVGYRIPEESVPISLENVQTDYNGSESRVTFHLTNGNSLVLVFPEDGGCVLVPEMRSGLVTSAAVFKREFPLALVIVPVLGPVEHKEQRRERNTVVSGLSTHRASRHFRSYWHYYPEAFDAFARLVARTWPGMSIGSPEYDHGSGELAMFCLEGRMTRELYWVGFGFQVWCQLLTHLSRANEGSLVVVDEPEVYLHPDVQRQLLGVIRDIGADVLLATHSSEIIAEADPAEIVMIDKRRRTGDRLKNVSGIQRALDAVGSSQNMTLTALAKNRRVLFVEGLDDFRLFRRFARKLSMHELGSGIGITPLESGGFGSWQRITVLASGIADALGAPLMIGAIYDRDYFCSEQIDEVIANLTVDLRLAHVLGRKEIENYLLVPAALDRAIMRASSGRDDDGQSRTIDVDSVSILEEITQGMKEETISQIMARRHDFFQRTGIDKSQIYRDAMSSFEKRWANIDQRLQIVPGKETLRLFRERIQESFGVTLTDARIIDAMHRQDFSSDLVDLLTALDNFRNAQF